MTESPAFSRLFGVSGQLADARKAALLLRTVCDNDRQWLLERLSLSEREVLTGLLAELEQLGLPSDRGLLHEVLRDESEGRVPADSSPKTEPSEQALLDDVSARHLARVMADEPAGLVAKVLAIRNWPWSTALLSELGEVKRRDVQSRLDRLECAKLGGSDHRPTSPDLSELDKRLLASLSVRLSLVRSRAAEPDEIDADRSAGTSRPTTSRIGLTAWWHRLGIHKAPAFRERADR